jgi:hypothetical protein
MTSRPVRRNSPSFVLVSLAFLAFALVGCSGADTSAGPSASVTSGGTSPIPSPTSSDEPSPSAPATPSSGQVTASPAAATPGQTIHLILHLSNDTVGSPSGCANPGSCRGDFMTGDDPLSDAATGTTVGTFAYKCFLVNVATNLYSCPDVTISLTGRGKIVFTEVIQHEPGRPPAISAITEGTGEFLGATGTVTAKVLDSGGDFVITLAK